MALFARFHVNRPGEKVISLFNWYSQILYLCGVGHSAIYLDLRTMPTERNNFSNSDPNINVMTEQESPAIEQAMRQVENQIS